MLSNKEALERAIIENPNLTKEEIENNHYWKRIEHDGSNTPYHPTKSYKTGYIIDMGFSRDNGQCSAKTVQDRFRRKLITHFRELIIDPNPIY